MYCVYTNLISLITGYCGRVSIYKIWSCLLFCSPMEAIMESESEHITALLRPQEAAGKFRNSIKRRSMRRHSNGSKHGDDVFYEAEEQVRPKEKWNKNKRYSTISIASSIAALAPFFKYESEEAAESNPQMKIKKQKQQKQSQRSSVSNPLNATNSDRVVSFCGVNEQTGSRKTDSINFRFNPERISMLMQRAADTVENMHEEGIEEKTVEDWNDSIERSFDSEDKEFDAGFRVPSLPPSATDFEYTSESDVSRSPEKGQHLQESFIMRMVCKSATEPPQSLNDTSSLADSGLVADEPISDTFVHKEHTSKKRRLRNMLKSILHAFR